MLKRTYAAALEGLRAVKIVVEADSVRGKPGLTIIGLAEKTLEEARERITSALSGCQVRLKSKKTVVNLAPADLRKKGSHLELALAIVLWQLNLDQQLTSEQDIFFGELALNGELRAIRGALPLVRFALAAGFKRAFIPAANQAEVQVIAGIEIYPLRHLQQALDFFLGQKPLTPLTPGTYQPELAKYDTDFADIIGQSTAKRCLEIAAAGGHNLLLTGVPGAGKSMLTAALPSILPLLTHEEALEVTTIYSIAGGLDQTGLITTRPYRAPHHTISAIGLVGGSQNLLPGEISLAHQGILFLDELGEFRRDALEILRQPLETGMIAITRATGKIVYPARFTLIAATNPCPCGYLGSQKRACTCSPADIARYRRKLSGPILDRLDLQIFVPEVEVTQLAQFQTGVVAETSAQVRARVIRARARQSARLAALGLRTNQELNSAQIRQVLKLEPAARQLLERAASKWQLSARSYFKIIKVARTIADLAVADEPVIGVAALTEALQYRRH
jgi:magnesium chelatase family protein